MKKILRTKNKSMSIVLLKQTLQKCILIIPLLSLSGCAGVVLVGATAGVKTTALPDRKKNQSNNKNDLARKIEVNEEPNIQKNTPRTNKKSPVKRSAKKSVPKIKPERKYPKFLSLNGIDSQSLLKTLGSPNFIRSDEGAQIWFYHSKNCKLHLFLYKDPKNSKFSVTHLEAKNNKKNPPDKDECIKNIINS